MGQEQPPLIHNPAAGGGRGRHRIHEALELLAAHGIDPSTHPTTGPGHATVLARELAEAGHKRILVLGGDGTFSEAANGILQAPPRHRPAVGVIPAGTGNDFLRDFGVVGMEAAILRIASSKGRAVDAARYTDASGTPRWSMNVLGTGFAAQAASLANRRLKWMGRQSYNAAVLLSLASFRPERTRLVVDGQEAVGDFPLVMVCNTVHTGGAMRLAPEARVDDGALDVLTAEGLGRPGLVGLLGKLRDGSHVRHPKVTMRQARRIHVEPATPGPILADGEVVGQTPLDVTVDAGCLRVLV